MENNTAIITFCIASRNISDDLEIPLEITANDFVVALNSAYKLDIDTANIRNCYLKSERPIALLKGKKTLEEFGIRNGSVIYFTEE